MLSKFWSNKKKEMPKQRNLMLDGRTDLKLNMGCSTVPIEGFLSVDVRPLENVDICMDLSRLELEPGSCESIISNAFFEHLPRVTQIAHLRDAKKALNQETGTICYLGIPDFAAVAREYLKDFESTSPQRFDAFQAYKHIAGEPDNYPYCYFEQLHKCYFDIFELYKILKHAGYRNFKIFTYRQPIETLSIHMGFCAHASKETNETMVIEFLRSVKADLVDFDTLQFADFSQIERSQLDWDSSMMITELHPKETQLNQDFNLQSWGDSAIAVIGTGFTPNSILHWEGAPLVTAVVSDKYLTGNIPKVLYGKVETCKLQVRDIKTLKISNFIEFKIKN